jgi:O-antigen ligase
MAFLFFLVWIPLPVGSNRPWAWSILEIWIYALSVAWLWGYERGVVAIPHSFIKARPVLMLLFLWLAYCAFQLLPLPAAMVALLSPEAAKMHALAGSTGWFPLSVDIHASLDAWLKSLAYALAFALALLLVTDRRRLESLAKTLVFSGLFQAFYGAFMTLSGLEYGFFIKKFAYIGNATGTFVSRNHFAGYLEMCLSCGMGLMIANLDGRITQKSGRQRLRDFMQLLLGKKFRLRLFLAVMVIALVLTHSRMGNTAFFSSMIAAGGLSLALSKRAPRSMVILIASLVVIDIVIVGTWFGVEKVVARLESTSIMHDADRIDVSENALRQWKDYYLFGSGGGSFYAVFPRYRSGDIAAFFDHAHDDYVEFASEYGFFGMLILASIVIASFAAALEAQFRRREPLMRGMAFSSTMGIISLMIHSFVDFNLQIPANAATFMVILALGWIARNLESH